MKIAIDEKGYVTGFATLGDVENGAEFVGEMPEDFAENCRYYRLKNGALVYDAAKKEHEEEQRQKAARAEELKLLLAETDYQAIKFAEGEMGEEDYAPIREARREWRREINEMEES